MGIRTLHEEIKDIMVERPATRDSDEVLYATYLARHGITTISVATFFNNFNKYEVSDFESVTRVRRKVAEQNPELRPKKEIEELRFGRQMEILDYVRK